jgi:hypothetical protein
MATVLAVEGLCIFSPPTSRKGLIVSIAEHAVNAILGPLVWQPLWQAYAEQYEINNPPSAVTYNNTVYVFFAGDPGSLGGVSNAPVNYRTCVGTTWSSADQTIPSTTMATGPGSAVFNNSIFVFWQDSAPGGALYCTTGTVSTGTDLSFTTPGQVGNASMAITGSPSAVVYGNELYVFYQSGSNNDLCYSLYSSTTTNAATTWAWGNTTTVPNVAMSVSASAVVFNNELYVFHQGGEDCGQLWYTVLNSSGTWAADTQIVSPNSSYPVSMQASPAACVSNGQLFVFYESSAGEQFWYVSSTDGSTWTEPAQVAGIQTVSTPSLIVDSAGSTPELYCILQGTSGYMWYSTIPQGNTSTWGAMTKINGEIMANSAGLVLTPNNDLLCFINGQGPSGALYMVMPDGTNCTASSTQLLNENFILGSPSAIYFNNMLYLFFQSGSQNSGAVYNPGGDKLSSQMWSNNIFYMSSTDNGQTWGAPTQVETWGSESGLAPVIFNSDLFLFYTWGSQLWYAQATISSGSLSWSHTQLTNCANSFGNNGQPAAATVSGDYIYVFWTDINNCVDYMYADSSLSFSNVLQLQCGVDSGASPAIPVIQSTSSSSSSVISTNTAPAVTVYSNEIYCVFKEMDANAVWWTKNSTSNLNSGTGWAPVQQMGGGSVISSTAAGAINSLSDLGISSGMMAANIS